LVQRIETKGIEGEPVMLAKPDLRPRQVDTWKDVIVLDGLILAIHAQSNDDVRREASVETDLPPQSAGSGLLAAGNTQGDREFIIDRQDFGTLILFHPTTDLADLLDGFRNDLRLQAAK
jgi:hypothetical protein